ncbi:hypothetical protein BB8028_0005g11320 [Beauveria bassiana]|uniref:CRAL-TRIO domain-containing protein n=1 Tax=Beauveria bassiana TaxID=176275 RepID=A0A2S7YHE7_BEABA|nr:hypothetical protein BB8028_0005g11320 [Beauveria bassiana]
MESQFSDSSTLEPRRTALLAPTPDSKPYPRPKLSPDQEVKYKTLLSEVMSWTIITCDNDFSKSGPITSRERIWLTRECLLRYLRATKWSIDEAVKRLQATLVWRREYGLDDLTPECLSPEQETGKQIILGYDKLGRPCQYLSPGRQNTDPSPRQIQLLFYMLERMIDMMPPGVESLVLMINFRPSKERQNTTIPVSMAREILSLLQNHYPERLGMVLMINVHWIIRAFLKIISVFMDPTTRDKFKYDNDTAHHVPIEQLWSDDWPGQLNFEYEHKVYWPTLNKECKQRREASAARWLAAGGVVGESEDYLVGGADVSVTGYYFDNGNSKLFGAEKSAGLVMLGERSGLVGAEAKTAETA